MYLSKYTVRKFGSGVVAAVGAVAGNLVATNDQLIVDCRDLEKISAYMVQVVQAGTVTLKLEKSPDGVLWVPVGVTKAQTDFAAGANQGIEFNLADSTGMPLQTAELRLTATALAGGGSYTLVIAGVQRQGYR